MDREYEEYSNVKWPIQNQVDLVEGRTPFSVLEWTLQYLKRAELLGFDQAGGRQALAKARTLTSLTETVVCLHGHLPDPGVPSGEIAFMRADRPGH